MGLERKIIWNILINLLLLFGMINSDGIRLPDQQQQNLPGQQAQQQLQQQQQVIGEERRQGKGLLDLVGLGTGSNVDPYVAKTNQNCLTGDLSECFKTHALTSFDEFFVKDFYSLTDFARVVRMPGTQLRSAYEEPFEYSSEPRSSDSEWDQLLKFGLRKAEKFIKSTAFEINIPEELIPNERYSARFINDIDQEIDVIEDKKASLLTRHRLKKLFIPLLLVLKIFKLKLLLFLPFILGLAGLKKILGLAAIVLPGLFAYFKLCRPQQGLSSGLGNIFGSPQTYPFQEYSPQGLGVGSYHEHVHHQNPFYRQEPTFSKPYTDYYSKNYNQQQQSTNGVRFGEQIQDLAYQGYSQYRNNNKEVS